MFFKRISLAQKCKLQIAIDIAVEISYNILNT